MNPSQKQDSPHDLILHALITYLRSMKMATRPDFRTAGAAIEAHLLQLSSLGAPSPTASSRLAESDAQDA